MSLIYFARGDLLYAEAGVICVDLFDVDFMLWCVTTIRCLDDLPQAADGFCFVYLTPFTVGVSGTGSRASGPTWCLVPFLHFGGVTFLDVGIRASAQSTGRWSLTAGPQVPDQPKNHAILSCPDSPTNTKNQDHVLASALLVWLDVSRCYCVWLND